MVDQYISYGEFLDEIHKRYRFKYSRTASYYLLYNGILFNPILQNHIREYAKELISRLMDEINGIQETSRSPISTKQILHHNSNIHISLRHSLNTWALVETSARVAVIRALAKALSNCPYNDWRFINEYTKRLVECLYEHEDVMRSVIERAGL